MPKVKKRKGKKKVRRRLPGKLTGATINGFPIRRVKVEDLDPADYNPREIRESALAGLKKSVETFGLPQAIVWNKRTRQMVGGHQRRKTLPEGSFTDVVEVDFTEEQEKALNLTLNNPYIMGEWTPDLGKILDDVMNADSDLMVGLVLDDLRVDVPEFPEAHAPTEFPEVDEAISTEHTCPKCGYSWS